MTAHHLKDPAVIKEIANAFRLGTADLEELADFYGVSRTTIRRILADEGLVSCPTFKSKPEKAILDYLKLHNITTVNQLKDRLLTSTSAQELYNNMSIESRVDWLNQSVKGGNNHERIETVQHSKHI